MGSTPTPRRRGGPSWRQTGLVSQVTYRVPLEFITRVNGAYNYGSTTYKFNFKGESKWTVTSRVRFVGR